MDIIKWVARYKISGQYAASAGSLAELKQILELLGEQEKDVIMKTELWRI